MRSELDELRDDRRIERLARLVVKDAERGVSTTHAGRYGRSDVSASKQSTTASILAPIGISSPRSPAG